ncbi:hypothetical protein BDA96_09G056400 [Sorghum bicolor]|uniref:GRF-type domain-containing protein n=1 Tax=Sorghum bicolor TaxID=4558 RepID=A0A921Q8Q7_SORBI|nr:hypothetical protein BDA96_09G056400 [Sorghum bicolor]
MSDRVDVQDSFAVRRALVQCTGGSPSPSPPLPSGSPSRSRSQEGDDTDYCCLSTPSASESEGESEMSVPDAKFETDWSDLHVVRVTRCEHGRPSVMKTVIGGKNTGRRFLGCPLEDNECAFTEWLDAP